MKETPIINIFTYGLPYKLAGQIYNEYQARLREATFFLENVERYNILNKYQEVIELLLALSIFHKRVVSNLDSAVKFYGTVTNKSNALSISIGNYNLNNDEKNKILGLLLNYRSIIQKYGINENFMKYYSTKEFLIKIIELKKEFEFPKNEEKE